MHVIRLLLLGDSLYWEWGNIRTNIRTNIGPANTNIRGGLWTTNANANISKCCEYVFVPTPTFCTVADTGILQNLEYYCT